MNAELARSIVFDPYVPNARVSVGFFRPTDSFKAYPEHIAVMDDETGGMLAITGPVVADDEETTFKSLCEAVVYAGAFEMFELVKRLAKEHCTADLAEVEAKGILESLRHKMDGLEPKGVSAQGLQACINHKLGLAHAEVL